MIEETIHDDKDVRIWLKIGDIYAKLGKKPEAAETSSSESVTSRFNCLCDRGVVGGRDTFRDCLGANEKSFRRHDHPRGDRSAPKLRALPRRSTGTSHFGLLADECI